MYKEGDVRWLVSPGGRIQFDWERERLFVWFVDTLHPGGKSKPDQPRRVDLWVSSRAPSTDIMNRRGWILIAIGTVFALILAYYLQTIQWEEDKRRISAASAHLN